MLVTSPQTLPTARFGTHSSSLLQDALAHIPQPQYIRVGSSDAIRHVLIEVLPPILVLRISRFRHDAAEIKIDKYIQFVPELKIPPGTIFIFCPSQRQPEAEDTRDLVASDITARQPAGPMHYKLYGVLHHHGESRAAGTIRLTFFARMKTLAAGKLGCTLTTNR